MKTTDRALATGTLASSAGASGAPGTAQLGQYQSLDCGAASPPAPASTEPSAKALAQRLDSLKHA